MLFGVTSRIIPPFFRHASCKHELFYPQSSNLNITIAAMRASLGVERSAGGATIVHLAREQVGDDRADHQNAAEDGDAQEHVLQPFYFSLKLR